MSLANIQVPNEVDLICNSLLADRIDCIDLFAQNQIVNNIVINNLQQDNTLDRFVVWDFNTSEVKYRDNVFTESIENAPAVTVPIYAEFASTPTTAVFNGLASSDPDFIQLNPAPPVTGGDIVINPGVKVVLTDNVATITNKTLDNTNNTIDINNGLIVTGGALQAGLVQLTSDPQINTDNDVLIYSALNGGRIDKRLDCVFTNAIQTMTNKTISDLVSTGSGDSMLSSKVRRFTFVTQTVGAVPANALTAEPIPDNTSVIVQIDANGFVSAGPASNGTIARRRIYRVSNIGGSVTITSSFSSLKDNSPTLNTASVQVTTILNAINVLTNGVAGQTIEWSGVITIIY